MPTPILHRLVIETVVLLPHEDIEDIRNKSCFEIIAEGEPAFSDRDWIVTSRISNAEDVTAARVAAVLAEVGADETHYDVLIERYAEALGLVPIRAGEAEPRAQRLSLPVTQA